MCLVPVHVRVKEHSFSREDTKAMFQRFLAREGGKGNMAAQADRSGSNGESEPRNRAGRGYDLPGSWAQNDSDLLYFRTYHASDVSSISSSAYSWASSNSCRRSSSIFAFCSIWASQRKNSGDITTRSTSPGINSKAPPTA